MKNETFVILLEKKMYIPAEENQSIGENIHTCNNFNFLSLQKSLFLKTYHLIKKFDIAVILSLSITLHHRTLLDIYIILIRPGVSNTRPAPLLKIEKNWIFWSRVYHSTTKKMFKYGQMKFNMWYFLQLLVLTDAWILFYSKWDPFMDLSLRPLG